MLNLPNGVGFRHPKVGRKSWKEKQNRGTSSREGTEACVWLKSKSHLTLCLSFVFSVQKSSGRHRSSLQPTCTYVYMWQLKTSWIEHLLVICASMAVAIAVSLSPYSVFEGWCWCWKKREEFQLFLFCCYDADSWRQMPLRCSAGHRSLCLTWLFQVLAELKPPGLKVVGGMPFVRNSVGEGEIVRSVMPTCTVFYQ